MRYKFMKRLPQLAILLILVWSLAHLFTTTWRVPVSLLQSIGLGELVVDRNIDDVVVGGKQTQAAVGGHVQDHFIKHDFGVEVSQTRIFSKVLVMGKMKTDSIDCLDDPGLRDMVKVVYSPDGTQGYRHTPKNKGREAMTYLTYMIDEYDNLADISIFMHTHRYAWHQPALLNDSVEIVQRLNPARVWREGYMNLRCQTDRGCPAHIRPGVATEDPSKKEEVLMAQAFAELFPNDPIPLILAQPCCGQFALSSEAIRAVPRDELVRYRQWLIDTKLRDSMSGRVMEYLWHYMFVKKAEMCPDQLSCYCDGYGLCFHDDVELNRGLDLCNDRLWLLYLLEGVQSSGNTTKADVEVWEQNLVEKERLLAEIKRGALQRGGESYGADS